MADWKQLKLSPQDVMRAAKNAEDTVLRGKPLLRRDIPGGWIAIARGPLFPVEGPNGDILPESAWPSVYLVYWYGRPGAPYPPEVNEYVLLQGESPGKGFKRRLQVWAASEPEIVLRIVKEAFGLDIELPTEEPKS